MLTEPGKAAMANSFSGGVFENNTVDSICFLFLSLLFGWIGLHKIQKAPDYLLQ